MRDVILRDSLSMASWMESSRDRRWLSPKKNLVSPFDLPERRTLDWLSMSCQEVWMFDVSSSARRVSRRDDLNSRYSILSMTTLSVASD